MTADNGRTRIALDFDEGAMRRLDDLREMTGAEKNAEVIRGALRLYEWVVNNRGRTVLLQISVDKIDMHLIPQSSRQYRAIMEEVRKTDFEKVEMRFQDNWASK